MPLDLQIACPTWEKDKSEHPAFFNAKTNGNDTTHMYIYELDK